MRRILGSDPADVISFDTYKRAIAMIELGYPFPVIASDLGIAKRRMLWIWRRVRSKAWREEVAESARRTGDIGVTAYHYGISRQRVAQIIAESCAKSAQPQTYNNDELPA